MSGMQDLFKKERDQWLDEARQTAKKLLSRRSQITVEDVLEQCPRPQYVHPNTTGRIFSDSQVFKAIDWRPSRRPLMNGRQVRVWVLR